MPTAHLTPAPQRCYQPAATPAWIADRRRGRSAVAGTASGERRLGQAESTPQEGTRPALVRAMGRWDLTAVGVNQVIGSGIFVMPATVAAMVGVAASPLPWIAAGIANALIVLCFAEAGTRFREAGGPYAYAHKAFGPFVGFEVAWMMWVTRVVSQAALANAFAPS